MQVKTTPNPQITPPDTIASLGEPVEHTDVETGSATLTPALSQDVEAVRNKLIASGISEKDIADASAWARRPKD